MAVYNLAEVKEIPIMQVLGDYGIEVNRHGFCKLRNEQTPSCKIYENRNTFYDFGTSDNGSVINLAKIVEELDTGDAIRTLANRYGVREQVEAHKKGYKTITNNQYLRLGIDQSELGIDMNKLYAENPVEYSNILRCYAIPSVKDTQQLYFYTIKNYLQLRYDCGKESFDAYYSRNNIDIARADYEKEYNLLLKCVKGCSSAAWSNISDLKPDVEKDINYWSKKYKPVIRDYDAEPRHFYVTRPEAWRNYKDEQTYWYEGVSKLITEGQIPPGSGPDAVDKKLIEPEDLVVILTNTKDGLDVSANYYDGEGFVHLQNYNPLERCKKADILRQVSNIKNADGMLDMQNAASFEI